MKSYNDRFPPKTDDLVALDTEILDQGDRTHIPDGQFGILAIADAKDEYLITMQTAAPAALRRVDRGTIAMHNSLYDLRYLRRWGATVHRLRVWDTMIAERILYGGYYATFGLDDLSRRYLRTYLDKSVREEFATLEEIRKRHLDYAAKDVRTTYAIAARQMKVMEKDDIDTYWKIEEPVIHAILDLQPVRIDVDGWVEMAADFKRRAEQIEADLGLNPRSPVQVKKALARRGIKVRNTKAETLEHHEGDELVDLILEARHYSTLSSTYGAKWIEKNVQPGGLVIPDFISIGAETRRMACRNPNMQQIPVRKNPEYRDRIIASPGQKIVAVDASMQEIRVAAFMSSDKALLDLLRSGKDPYVQAAIDIFGTPDMRSAAKTIVLGLNYGLSAYGLASRIKVSVDEAEAYLDKFFDRFPGVRNYLSQQRRSAQMLGYVRDALGGKIHINPYSPQAENNAVNAPIQATAALITKLALAYQHNYSRGMGGFYTTMVVHDEIVGEVPDGLVDEYVDLTRQAWMDAARAVIPGIPFDVDVHVGQNWGGKK